ncbi:hypothetical protein [Qipengyuania sp.]|uniref:hypothetical protein n=1 Tax=Qipengyuania sp. TaxID=2004515 RepID=UPI0035C7A8AF
MERRHRKAVEARFRAQLSDTRLLCLDIPDRYRFMDPGLVDLLERRMAPHLA